MKSRFLESLRARLMLLVALALVPAIALTAYSAIEQRSLQTHEVETSNLQVARLIALEQEGIADHAHTLLLALSHTPELASGSPAQCNEALRELAPDLPYESIGVATVDGRVICTTGAMSTTDLTPVSRAAALGTFAIGSYVVDSEARTSTISFALPISSNGQPGDRILFATSGIGWLDVHAEHAGLPAGAILLAVDGGGRVVGHYPSDTDWLGRGLGNSALLDGILTEQEGVMTTSPDGKDVHIFAFTPLLRGIDPVYIAVGLPRDTALAGVSAAFARDITMLVIVGGLAFTAAWFVSDVYIVRNMRRLTGATLRLRSGVMTARTGIPHGHGEFSQLARWFDEMAAALEREHTELRRLGKLELYRLLADNANDLISRLTPEGSILYTSPASRQLLGVSPEVLVGRFVTGLTHDEDAEATKNALRAAITSPGHTTVTHRLRRVNGEFVWLETSLQGVRDESGEVTEIISVSRDITERMRGQEELESAREAAEAAAKAKSEFLANMSHEIRTPMNAVIGMSSLLEDTPLDSEQREFVDTIRASGDHLLTIINDILDFSKIESAKLAIEHQRFDLRQCVEESLDLLAGEASRKHIELAYDITPGTPEWLVGDAGRVRQVLVNLLSNAVKFTAHGEVILTVSAHEEFDGIHEVQFGVRDTGIGIPAERIPNLFNPFFQVDASTTRQYGGSGLGLAISKHLCEAMGGSVRVESTLDVGSTFTGSIRGLAVEPPRPHARGPEVGLAGRRVLIVDDNATNRRILSLQLRRWGMICKDAASAGDALAWLDAGNPCDLALLDLRMPDVDGVELAIAIRDRRDELDLPLVLLSSIGGSREATKVGSVRFQAALSKPVKPRQLHTALLTALRGPGVAAEGERGSPQRFDPQTAARNPLRILLVEDNHVNQMVAVRMLARLGYTPDVANNGREAVEAATQDTYDLILMDVQMPGMDGLEASRAIRASPRNGKPRIVAMTAHTSADDRQRCQDAGMDDYVGKPIRTTELVAALSRAAASAKATSQARTSR